MLQINIKQEGLEVCFLGNARGAESWHQLWEMLPTFHALTSILSIIDMTRMTALHKMMPKSRLTSH